jgi:ubiquinone/menaquinone biosynthesis C-methylase UbiE
MPSTLHITALEISEQAIIQAQEQCVYNEYINTDVCNINQLATSSFDAVVAFDFIEHLTKTDGLKLLNEMERIARKKVVVYTPNGFLPQEAFDNNPYQKHLSGWTYNEMQQLGYNVYGINGNKKWRGEYSMPKVQPLEFGRLLANLSAVWLKVTRLESNSYSILCIKHIAP